ncbi:MAG: superfamily protein [Paenibacillaceae bacterium]|jgi:putative molybdopterin biosynthesis protein|nr:superfamily protein [Paenibacillaceae bacterium]
MPDDISYTTEEIAKLLRVSKLTVYDLIKKGELPSYRVGKQMRVDASDLEAYKSRAKGGRPPKAPVPPVGEVATAPVITHHVTQFGASAVKPLVITGQDTSLDILAKYIEKQNKQVRPLRSFVGSLDSLISMYHGESDVVSTHMFDGDTGEYNVPYIRKLLVGFSYIVVNLASRNAGIYVAKGNPHGISSWEDLTRPEVRIVNRERGSGARILLDEQLRLRGISRAALNGYLTEESSHLGVAGKVASAQADAGVGIEKAAAMVGVDFVPLIQERYDLVMLKKPANTEWMDTVVRILQSESFANELRSIGGYDLSQTGKVIWETE